MGAGRSNMSIWINILDIFKNIIRLFGPRKRYTHSIPLALPRSYSIIPHPFSPPSRQRGPSLSMTMIMIMSDLRALKYKIGLLFTLRKGIWDKEAVIKDSFITPYYKIIGCKIHGHNWSTHEDSIKFDFPPNRFHCWKCSKWTTRSKIRNVKIDDIFK